MSSFGTNNQNANNNTQVERPAGKEDVFNKISFSSVKLGQTKQGSNTVGLYMGRDQMEKLQALLTELLSTEAGQHGCKIGVIVISGKSYDSGYAYVNPKEPKRENTNGNNQGNGNYGNRSQGNGGYRKQNGGNFGDRSQAKSFLAGKRLGNESEGNKGN